jgi:endonuclease YncB( thermonuclease family)
MSRTIFLQTRLLSACAPGAGILLAGFAFVLGFCVGAAIGPIAASRSAPAPVSTTTPASAPARGEPSAPVRAAHPAEVLHVLDGDTFEARVHLWPGLSITTRVRLRDIDAPELKARCHEERVKAEAAREALRAMLAQGEVGINKVTLDKYAGRVLANASTFSTPNVATALLDAGYVRAYAGARRETWCS